jgi:transglutaminase-like putative cysteine protease
MKKILFLFILCGVFTLSFSQSETLNISNISENLIHNASAVIRSENTEIEMLDYDNLKVKYNKTVTILSKDSNEDVLVVHYDDFKKVSKINAEIYDAFGTLIRTIKKNEVQDIAAVDGFSIYSDNRIKYLDIDYNQYPYTIKFEYEYVTKKFKYYPSWYVKSFGVAVQSSTFSISLPIENEVQYKAYNFDIIPIETNEEDRKKLSWEVNDSPALVREAYMPISDQVLPYLVLSPTTFKLGKYKGDMSSWQSYGKFMHELNKDRDVVSESLQLKIKALVKDASSDREKVDILYNYLKENMRYVSVQLGVGGWQTFDAAYVEKNKYGDCKALTNFTMAMLKVAGIEANTALINSGARAGNPDPDFTMPRFNHVILNVPSEDLWLECTSSANPTGYLGVDNYGKNVLLVTENGGEFSSTPAWPFEKNVTKTKTNVEILNSGSAKIINETYHEGDRHDMIRGMKKNYSQTEIEKAFLEQFELSVKELLNLELAASPDQPNGLIKYELISNKYGSKAGKRFFIPLNPIHKFGRKLKKIEHRIHPIVIKDGYVEENEISIQLPENISLESFPKERIEFNSPYGSYQLELISEAGKLQYVRKIVIKPIDIPASEYNALRNFYKKILKADNTKIVALDNRT